jgi:tRNA threonylcarbamoyl adenosine modification protein YeaZ
MGNKLYNNILALDTAMNGCSVAVLDTNTDIYTSETKIMNRGQAEYLVPMINEILENSQTKYQEIDLIVTTIGPGAFTGLRIGLTTAKTLGVTLDKPVAGMTTLEVLAESYFKNNNNKDLDLLVLIETKRNDFYCQIFGADGSASTKAEALSQEEIEKLMDHNNFALIGDASARFLDNFNGNIKYLDGYDLPDPKVMIDMAISRYSKKEHVNMPEPLYLRGADVSKPKRPQRTIAEK